MKWGFDPGDCFTVFPLLPLLTGESEEDRWTRSFCPLKEKGEMLCIESSVVEALLRRMLEEHFHANLDINSRKVTPWRAQGFDWYYDNAYTVSECRVIRDKLRVLSSTLEGIPENDAYTCPEMDESSVHAWNLTRLGALSRRGRPLATAPSSPIFLKRC